MKQEQSYLDKLGKNIKNKEKDFENKSIYKKLAKNFGILNNSKLSKRIEEKNNNLTERFLFLLSNEEYKNNLISEKIKELNI